MRQTKTFSLLRASQINALHPTEIQPPGLVTAKNVYISPSDNAVTLRHDYYTFRDDIPTLVDHWTGSTSEDKSDFLNILLTGPVYTDQQCITRLFPTGIGGTVLSSTYIDGTITTSGTSAVVTGSGTTWVKNIWPGSFIQFAGSSNIYLIKLVTSDTSLTVDGTPPALSGVTYKVYRTHDFERGLYPGHFDQLANNYVYNMATPFDNDSESINSICGPFTMVKPIARVPEIQELNNSNTPVTLTTEQADVYPGSSNDILGVANNATRYIAVSLTKSPVEGSTSVYNYTLVFLTSTDGSSWTTAAEITPDVPDGYETESPNGHEKFGNGVQNNNINNPPILRYISSDGFYCSITQNLRRYTGVGTPAVYGYIDGLATIYKSSDGLSWSVFATYLMRGTSPGVYPNIGFAPDIASNGSFYLATFTQRIFKITSDGTQTRVFPPQDGVSQYYNRIVWNGTNFIAVGVNSVITSSDGTTWSGRVMPTSSGYYYVPFLEIGKTNHIWCGKNYITSNSQYSTWTLVVLLSTDNGVTWAIKDYIGGCQNGGCSYDATDDLTVFVGTGLSWNSAIARYSWSSTIKTTQDEATFTSRAIPSGNIYLSGVSSFSGATTGWVAVGSAGVIIASTDGTTWTKSFDVEQTPDLYSISSSGSYFMTSGENGSIALGDGSGQWTFQPVLTDKDLYDCIQINGPRICCGETGTIRTSDNGTSWVTRTSGVTVILRGIAWDFVDSTSRVVVVVGDATGGAGVVRTSSDLSTWTGRTSNTTKSLNDVCHNRSNLFVAVGEDGAIIASADGTTWAAKTSGTAEDLNGVCYSKPLLKFCAVGDAGTVLTSTDGTTWAAATSGVTTDLYAVTWTGSTLVAVGASGTMIESQDGVTWTTLDTDTTVSLYDVMGGGGYRIAVGTGGIVVKVYDSTLASQWIPVSDTFRAAGFSVASGYLVLVGTSEFENGRWVYHPRRVRWTTPGTVDDFTSEGSGASDLPGTGQISDARTLGYNVILFESSQVSVLNSTDDIFSPWSYQVIHSQMRCISNPLVLDQQCYFISPDGKLQRTNGFQVSEVCQPFDLTKYKDFDDAGPIWLNYDREMRRILCYRPRSTDSEHLMYVVDPENATVTSIKLEDVTVAGGGYYQGASGINFARSLPIIPTDYKFISDLELYDKDGDGDPETPVRKPFDVRWLICDINKQGATIVDYTDASMSGAQVVVTIDDSPTVLTEGTEWNAATSNDDTATSLASAIDALSGVSASAVGAVVTVTKTTTVVEINIQTNADATGMVINYDNFRSHCYSATDAQFVICGIGGKVYTLAGASVSALPTINEPSDCTERTSGTAENLLNNGYDGSYYICTGDNSTIIRSTDGVTWAAASAVATRVATDGIYVVLDSIYAPFTLAGSIDSSTDDYYVLKSVDNGDNWTDTGGTSILAYQIVFVNDLDGTMSYEVLDYSALSGATVTVRIDGTNSVLTEGAEWTAATDNDTTASSLATAIAALTGTGATASGAVVTVTADSTTTGLFLSTDADAANLAVTNSSRFWIIGGGAWESFDGVTWIQGNGITSAVQAIFYRQGTYYLVGINKVFYSPRDDVSTSRNWYEVDHPVDFSASCGEEITGVDPNGPITVIGTYVTPEDYYYWTDNGSRFFEVPKPDPPTNNMLEMWSVKWTGTFALALATDQVELE